MKGTTSELVELVRQAFDPKATDEELQKIYRKYEDWWCELNKRKAYISRKKWKERKQAMANMAGDVINATAEAAGGSDV